MRAPGICLAADNPTDNAVEIEFIVHQISGEPIQQLGMARVILVVHLINSHHESIPEQAVPQPIDERLGENVLILSFECHFDQLCSIAEFSVQRIFDRTLFRFLFVLFIAFFEVIQCLLLVGNRLGQVLDRLSRSIDAKTCQKHQADFAIFTAAGCKFDSRIAELSFEQAILKCVAS